MMLGSDSNVIKKALLSRSALISTCSQIMILWTITYTQNCSAKGDRFGCDLCSELPQVRSAGILVNGLHSDPVTYRKAIHNLNDVIKTHKDCSFAYFYRAQAWSFLKEHSKAASDIDLATKLNERSPSILFWAARIHEDAGQFQKAIEDIDRLTALPSSSPQKEEVWYLSVAKARNYLHMEKVDLALDCLNGVIMKRPDSIEALCLRGECYERRREYNEALQDYKKAAYRLETVPGGPWATPYCKQYSDLISALRRLKADYKPVARNRRTRGNNG